MKCKQNGQNLRHNSFRSNHHTLYQYDLHSLPRLVCARSWHCKSVDVGYITLSTRIMALVVSTGDETNTTPKIIITVNEQ